MGENVRAIRMIIGFLIGIFGATIIVAAWYFLILPARSCPVDSSILGPPPQCRYYNGIPYAGFNDYLATVPSAVTYFLGGIAGVIGGAVFGN